MRGLEHIPWLYDATMALAERGLLRRWRVWLARNVGARVLEIGCGTGRQLSLYDADRTVVACDPDHASLLRARRRAPHVPVVQTRAEALPFRDGTFDTVASSLVFCSVDEPATGLAEVRRVLAKEGTLCMIEHVRARSAWRARLQDFIQPAWTRLTGGCRPNRSLEESVTAAGFRIDEKTRRASGLLRRFKAFRV